MSLAQISKNDAFKLHDTYGFPIDLTRIMAEERGLTVDIAGYEKLMEQAKDLARSGGRKEGSKLLDLPHSGPGSSLKQSKEYFFNRRFTSKYDHMLDRGEKVPQISAKVMAIWNGDDQSLSPADVFEDEELAVILDKTDLYAEMGGQVGDRGYITSPIKRCRVFDVETTKHDRRLHVLHIGRLRRGKGLLAEVGDSDYRG